MGVSSLPSCRHLLKFFTRLNMFFFFLVWQNLLSLDPLFYPLCIAPSSTSFFPLCLLAYSVFKFAWTQGPCLLRKWVKHRHTCEHAPYVHTNSYKPLCTRTCIRAHMHSVLYGQTWLCSFWQAFNSLLSLTSWCSVYKSCQSQPNQKLFPLSWEQLGAEEVCCSRYVNTDFTIPISWAECSHLCKCCFSPFALVKLCLQRTLLVCSCMVTPNTL